MENIVSQLQHLADEVKSYVNVRIDLLKLNVAETASSIIANTMAKVISGIIFLFFLLFGSIGLSLFLSSVIGNSYSGFLIVAGIYLALGLLIWYTRKKFIQAPIMNAIIRQLFSENGKGGINRQ
jgi:hypothetical protein